MKSIATSVLLTLLFSSAAFAQSESFKILHEKFAGAPNVVTFRTSGALTRSVLGIAGERNIKKAIRDVRSVRLIVIPRSEFREKQVTLSGFQKIAEKDSFEPLVKVRDGGDDVTLLVQTLKKKDPRYLFLIDNDNEIVVVEVKGQIDERLLFKDSRKVTYLN
jgi:hypothetical protein